MVLLLRCRPHRAEGGSPVGVMTNAVRNTPLGATILAELLIAIGPLRCVIPGRGDHVAVAVHVYDQVEILATVSFAGGNARTGHCGGWRPSARGHSARRRPHGLSAQRRRRSRCARAMRSITAVSRGLRNTGGSIGSLSTAGGVGAGGGRCGGSTVPEMK